MRRGGFPVLAENLLVVNFNFLHHFLKLTKKMKENGQILEPVDTGDIDRDLSVEGVVDVEDGYVSDGDRDVVEPPPPPPPSHQDE